MQYHPFSVAVGAEERLQVLGNFVAYYRCTSGQGAPTIRVKSSRGHEVILKPGETIRFPEDQAELLVANHDGANTIAGEVFVGRGDFVSNRIEGEVTISLIEQGATVTNVAEKTVGVAEGLVVAAAASRRSLRFRAVATNTGKIYLGAAGVTTANGCIELAAGDIWVESDGAAAAWSAISDTAAQKLRVQEVS